MIIIICIIVCVIIITIIIIIIIIIIITVTIITIIIIIIFMIRVALSARRVHVGRRECSPYLPPHEKMGTGEPLPAARPATGARLIGNGVVPTVRGCRQLLAATCELLVS